MNNGEICRYVRALDYDRKRYVCELCVDEGYGQTCGGYLESNATISTQKEHFLGYYGGGDKVERAPSYHFLRCPQLLLFIAEIAGVSRKRVEDAYEKLKKYEEEEGKKNTDKNGNYIWGKQILRDIKEQLCISAVVKILKESTSWDEVEAQTREL